MDQKELDLLRNKYFGFLNLIPKIDFPQNWLKEKEKDNYWPEDEHKDNLIKQLRRGNQ